MMKKIHILLIAAIILAWMMLYTGCNLTDRYDVKGTWVFTGEYASVYFEKTLTFSGNRTQGTVVDELNGTTAYSFDGYNVNLELSINCF